MVDKKQAETNLSFSMADISLKLMAKNYAVNTMALKRLSLIFAQQQQGRPLTQEEIETVSEANKKKQLETEEIVLADLYDKLSLASDDAIERASKDGSGEVQ